MGKRRETRARRKGERKREVQGTRTKSGRQMEFLELVKQNFQYRGGGESEGERGRGCEMERARATRMKGVRMGEAGETSVATRSARGGVWK